MAVYLIGYDLIKDKDYSSLFEEIKTLGEYCKPLKSEWLVDTSKSAKEISDILRKKMDSDDIILVNKFARDYFGYLPQNIWDWIEKHLT